MSSAIIDKFTCEELINGTTDGPSEGVKFIDPIDTTWESLNVFDGQGYYSENSTQHPNFALMASELVSMDKVLRKMADQFTAGLLSKFGLNMDITFTRSQLEGEYHPARWCPFIHYPYKTKNPDGTENISIKTVGYSHWWLQQKIKDSPVTIPTGFRTYGGDKQKLYIDPDGAGTHPEQQIYLKYRLIKKMFTPPVTYLGGLSTVTPFEDEPNESVAKDIRWSHFKSFSELIYAIGLSLGLTVVIEPVGKNTMNIQFFNRSNFKQTKIYLKTATSAKLKGTADPIDATGKTESFVGKSNPYAEEGPDMYVKEVSSVETDNAYNDLWGKHTFAYNVYQRNKSDAYNALKSGKELCLTISPTIVYMDVNGPNYRDKGSVPIDPYNDGMVGTDATFPFGYYLSKRVSGDLLKIDQDHKKEHGISTAMWMYVGNYSEHKNANGVAYNEAVNYWTPVGAMSMQRVTPPKYPGGPGTLVSIYKKMSDYLNELYSIDEEYFDVAYDLDVPSYYGFSTNADGSLPTWKCVTIGAQITIDGVDYTVIGINRKLNQPLITLKLTGTAKFDFDIASLTGDQTHERTETTVAPPSNAIVCTASGSISIYDYVVRNNDGTVSTKGLTSADYGNNVGIALESVNDGELLYVKTAGLIMDSDFSWQRGGDVRIMTPVTHAYNLGQTELSGISGTSVLSAKVATAQTETALKILEVDEWIYEA